MIHQPLPVAASTRGPSPLAADQRNYYETLLAHLYDFRARPQGFLQTVGLTSCQRGEGVSTVAAHLAIHAAEAFATQLLLVETGGRAFDRRGTRPQPPGLMQLLAGSADLADCVRSTPVPNLSLLSAGGGGEGDRDRVHPGSIAGTLDQLRREFALVVVDLPPAGESGLCLGIAAQLDGVLLIVEAERGQSQAARRAKQALVQIGANVMGVVFNKRREHVPRWLFAKGYRKSRHS